jgi:plastocyanin
MTSVDKMGMVVAIGVVAVFLGFTATGGSGTPSDIPTTVSPVIEQAEVIRKDLETKTEKIKAGAQETREKLTDFGEETQESLEETAEMLEDPQEVAKKGMQRAEEMVSAKASVRHVSIPQGTAVPGCEEEHLCYDPEHLIIFADAEVIWTNDDTAAHTVTSGSPKKGPSGKFDSGLILSGGTFIHKFASKGAFDYFCMVHPWMVGIVEVR